MRRDVSTAFACNVQSDNATRDDACPTALTAIIVYPSEMTVDLIKNFDNQGWPKTVVPLQRAGDAQDLAGTILFLASRAGAYLNGNVLITDGGKLATIPSTY